jgi:phosphoglucosamine mutase
MKYFGTDGIRGEREIFTEDMIRKVSYAATRLFPNSKILLARDTRESGERILGLFIRFLTEYGADVISAGMTPTPVASFLTRAHACGAGIMISASHNPPEYNGIKFFAADGRKIDDETEERIEYFIDRAQAADKNTPRGIFMEIEGDDEYTAHIFALLKPDLAHTKIIMDTANGATAVLAPKLFRALGADVTVIHGETDGKRINENCGATCIGTLTEAMKTGGYDWGFSYDGDGDRLFAVKNGQILDGDHIMYIATRYFLKNNRLRRPVMVGTVMTNLGVEVTAKKRGITLIRTPVGDKCVSAAMAAGGYCVGGETSGHLIFSDYQNTGDGILSSLILARIGLCEDVFSLDDIQEYPQTMINIKTTAEKIKRFKESAVIKEFLESAEKQTEGRIVVRASGTEPKIRIMTEEKSKEKGRALAEKIRDFIWSEIEDKE